MLKKTKQASVRTRIQIVLLYHQGKGTSSIAEILECAPATAVRVLHRFRDQGEDAMMDGRRDNGCTKVDDDLLQALAEILSKTPEDFHWPRPTWTKELLTLTLIDLTQVQVSVTTVSRMLYRLKARWGMARPVVACPWTKWKKTRQINRIKKMLRCLSPGEKAFYEDELDIHLNPRIGRDWMLRNHQRSILTPGQNKKRYIAGALAVDGSGLVFVTSDRKNSDLFLCLLEKLLDTFPDASKIHLVLDNYKIHKSKVVNAFLCHRGIRVALHFLPPYCPDYNRIERFWREVHANVTRNHRCKTINQLMDKVKTFMHRENRKMKRASCKHGRTSHAISKAA